MMAMREEAALLLVRAEPVEILNGLRGQDDLATGSGSPPRIHTVARVLGGANEALPVHPANGLCVEHIEKLTGIAISELSIGSCDQRKVDSPQMLFRHGLGYVSRGGIIGEHGKFPILDGYRRQ